MIKLVASDIDGTLIYKNSKLNTVRFPVMLDVMSERNIPFCVATGRHYRELKKIFKNELHRFTSVCCDGAYTITEGKIVNALPISTIALKYFYDAFSGTDAILEFHSVNQSYILGATPLLYSKECTRLSNVIKINSYNEIDDDIYFLSVYGNLSGFIPHENVRLSYESSGIHEYANRNTSKESAVSDLAKDLGTSLEHVMFFGDGSNDSQLIKNSGISYTTYCADKKVFNLTNNHTRDVIGTIIRLCNENKI